MLFNHSRRFSIIFILVFTVLCVFTPGLAAQEDQEISFFLPINKNKKLGKKFQAALLEYGLASVEVRFSDHWHRFQQGIRTGRKGIYLAAPHYAAWAINRHHFIPLIRLKEPLRYVIATKRANAQIFEINDLAKQTVCTQKPLNLDYLLINSAFGNELLSANTKTTKSVAHQMRADNTSCVAFAVSDHYVKQLELKRPNQFIRLHQGQIFNNYVFVIHPDINPDLRHKLRQFLNQTSTQQLLQPVLKLYATNTNLVNAKKEDYPSDYAKYLMPYWTSEKP